MTLFWLWLVIAGAFVVAEVFTLAFFAAFLALAAAGAAVASLLGLNLLVQALVFGAVGIGGIFAGRPYLMRALARRREPILRSGAEWMIGQKSILVDPIGGPSAPGHVRIAGELWPAVSASGAPLKANAPVVVTGLKSATLIVEPTPEEHGPAA